MSLNYFVLMSSFVEMARYWLLSVTMAPYGVGTGSDVCCWAISFCIFFIQSFVRESLIIIVNLKIFELMHLATSTFTALAAWYDNIWWKIVYFSNTYIFLKKNSRLFEKTCCRQNIISEVKMEVRRVRPKPKMNPLDKRIKPNPKYSKVVVSP